LYYIKDCNLRRAGAFTAAITGLGGFLRNLPYVEQKRLSGVPAARFLKGSRFRLPGRAVWLPRGN